LILSGRAISTGEVRGTVAKVDDRVSFLGDVDPETGLVFGEKKIKDSIFVFPEGKGSTVGSYVIYQLKKNGTGPKGIINRKTETIVASGAIISDIPLVDDIDIDLIEDGDMVHIDGAKGEVDILDVDVVDVVTAFLVRDDSLLLFKRSDDVRTFKGKWAGVSGYLEKNDPLQQAKIEINEETDLESELLAEGETVLARSGKNIWRVHPYLFSVEGEPELDRENEKYEWVRPEKIKSRDTVPKLWEAYESARWSYENQD